MDNIVIGEMTIRFFFAIIAIVGVIAGAAIFLKLIDEGKSKWIPVIAVIGIVICGGLCVFLDSYNASL